MSERKYFPINESSARTAHNMMSMRDYSEGSTTSAYRSEVDKAYGLADKVGESLPTGGTLRKENGGVLQQGQQYRHDVSVGSYQRSR